jgi:hypothetical protein
MMAYFVRDLYGKWEQSPCESLEDAEKLRDKLLKEFRDGYGGFPEYAIVESRYIDTKAWQDLPKN